MDLAWFAMKGKSRVSFDRFRIWVSEAEAGSFHRFAQGPIVRAPNDRVPIASAQRGGELLWEVATADHVLWRAELFDEQQYGFDVRLFCADSFFTHRRFADRDSAIAWAEGQWAEIARRWKD